MACGRSPISHAIFVALAARIRKARLFSGIFGSGTAATARRWSTCRRRYRHERAGFRAILAARLTSSTPAWSPLQLLVTVGCVA
jgi:hypothetical protein